MQRIEKTVFISYRRTNTPWALAIYHYLTGHGYDVFFDYNSIKSGDYSQIITQNIEGRAHFVVVLTPSSLERCHEPGDWVRREIELALEHKRNIVPLFLEGFSFSTPSIAEKLTGKLAALKRYNGLKVPVEYFDAAMEKLRTERLNVALDTILHPITPTVREQVKQQQLAASNASRVDENALTAQEWFERGMVAETTEDEIYCYTQAITLKQDYPEAYNNRGNARANQGDLVGAIADFTRSIELNNPELFIVYNNRGAVRADHGDLNGAVLDYNEAIRLDPDYPMAYYNRGNVHRLQRNLDRALSDYTQAIRCWPGYAKAYNNRGITRRILGNLKEAIQDFTEAIRLEPNYALAYKNRGYDKNSLGDILGTLMDYQQYLDLGGGRQFGDQAEMENTILALKERYIKGE